MIPLTAAPPTANGQPAVCLRPRSAWIELPFALDGHAVATGRRFIASKLTSYGDVAYDTAVVGSELLTNANDAIRRALAAGQTGLQPVIGLCVRWEPRWVRVSVIDPVHDLPQRRTASEHDVHGRGLAIVEDLAEILLIHPHARGKTIHAVIAVPDARGYRGRLSADDLDQIVVDL